MKHIFAILLFVLTGLPALSQTMVPGVFKLPNVTGATVLNEDVQGYLVRTTKAGTPTRIKVDPSVSSLTAYQSMATLRVTNLTAILSPTTINITDPDVRGTFYLDASDEVTPDDSALTIVTASGLRYKYDLSEGRLTAQRFHAKGDGIVDDGPALQKWLNKAGAFELYLPAGTYRSSIALTRTNKGAVTITGAGSGRTKLLFSGNTSGLSIANPLNGNYGAIVVRGLEIVSTGNKTGSKDALLITSQHDYRPGPTVDDVPVKCMTAGQEWATGIHYHDCSGTTTARSDIQGASLSVCTGISITNSVDRPSVEHLFLGLDIRNVYRGYSVITAATGSYGIEGVKWIGGNVVNVFQGIYAHSYMGSPDLSLSGIHINAFGGECIYLDGYQQVSFHGPKLYSNANNAGLIPGRAVYIKNTIACRGDLMANLSTNIPYAVEFAGTGGAVDMDVTMLTESGASTVIKNISGYAGSQFGLSAVWTGNTTWGGATGHGIDGPGLRKFSVAESALYPPEGSVLMNKAGVWTSVSRIEATRLVDNIYTNGNATIDPSASNLVRIDNGATAVTMFIDQTKLAQGQTLLFVRVGASTGAITIRCVDTANNKMGQPDGSKADSFSLLTTTGLRQATFYFDGANLELIAQ